MSKCDHHLRIGARTRFNIFFDNGNFTEIASNVETGDPLGFKDVKAYPARIKEAKKNTGRVRLYWLDLVSLMED